MAYFHCLPKGCLIGGVTIHKNIFEIKGKTMYLHYKMVYNKI